MQTTIYIRKENEEFWKRLGKDKSKWVNEQITNKGTTTRPATDEITYAPIVKESATQALEPAPKLKVMTNDDLKALLGNSGKKPIVDEPRHVCKDNCKHWVWDVDRGGRTNTLTGEFQEGEPW